MASRFSTFFSRLVPEDTVAGLDITDSACRLLVLSKGNLGVRAIAEAALPAGAVVQGELKNSAGLIQALETLKRQAGRVFSENPMTILTLPSALFYSHVIELPEVQETSYEEAARLNAMQISPIPLEEGYFDWQNLGVNLKTYQREFLIALAPRSKIDPYLDALARSGIRPVAVEPSSLGLMRLLNYFVATAEKTAPYLLIAIGKDGISFVITKEGKPFFDQYIFWQEIEEAKDREVTRQDFETILIRETTKLLNFYRTHYQEEVGQAILMAPILKQELAELLSGEFKLKIIGLRFPTVSGAPLSDLWAVVLGAALRGIIPRGEDTIVSLMPTGTEVAYAKMRAMTFFSLWSKIVIGTLLGILISVGTTMAVLLKFRESLVATLREIRRSTSAQEFTALREEAERFNQLVDAARKAEAQAFSWSPIVRPIVEDARDHGVRLDRVSLTRETKTVRIQAFSPSRQRALDYKNSLEDSGAFSLVDLPLSSFSIVGGGVTFLVNVTLK